MNRKEKFKTLMEKVFAPEDVKRLTEELVDMGYFTAPASTRHHGDWEGGLFDHSYEVAKALVDLTEKLSLKWEKPRSPHLVGLLHDLCKCDSYMITESGIERNKDALPGHGDKSVAIAQDLLEKIGSSLTEEEELSIRWHMGAFDDRENWGAYGGACEKYPNVLYTHTADMIASSIVGI